MSSAVDITPGSEEWQKRLTASRFDLLFAGPSGWRRLRRDMLNPQPRATFANGEHGHACEPRAAALYSIETGRDVYEPGFRALAEEPRIGCTVDRLTTCGRMLEIKSPLVVGRHLLARQGVYDSAYHWQMFGGLWLWELDVCDFVSFCEDRSIPLAHQLAIVEVGRDERLIARLRDTAFRFFDWFDQAEDETPSHNFLQPGATSVPKLF